MDEDAYLTTSRGRKMKTVESDSLCDQIPFSPGDWLIDRNNPGQPCQYTGNCRKAGPHIMIQVTYSGGSTMYRPLSSLEARRKMADTIEDRLKEGRFGKIRDLRRLITYEKLKGVLHEVIYSMEAAQIDFYPYQFKPVLKFINSPTERLIIADEVGLGKTIEAALIWIELQARRQAKRLLVVCPKILAEKWRDELRNKFLIDARIIDFTDLQQEIRYLKSEGPGHSFALIGTYTGLRPPRPELKVLSNPPDEQDVCSQKTGFLREIRHWQMNFDPLDLVIFDEAHYMRNPASSTFNLGLCLAETAGSVLCVSATPVNNSNIDLHSLLRLTDESFFGKQGMFEELLEVNRPTVQAGNALSKIPVDMSQLVSAIEGMSVSPFIQNVPLFKQIIKQLESFDPKDKAQLAKCQDIIEKLNLLGSYINRTRRVQVKENRPVREPMVLPVVYTDEEMKLYRTILKLVRARCRKDNRPFHVFQSIGLQLRAASCLPALAMEIRSGRLGDIEDLFVEDMDEDIFDDLEDELSEKELYRADLETLFEYDFEANDSKYNELKHMLVELVPNEKVIIFAYYRPTLAYLQRRLKADGINVTAIHGGIPNERRWEEIERFKDPRGPRVLLSSEVGSEGIDLQFCRVMANYDLPWNPMRVEQRIGRIDRVGQQARKLSIVNFKVRDTIEERLYDRLHAKLERFANSLGDLEAVIGKEVQHLTVELLSKELSPEEELRIMELSERAIEEQLILVQALEESGDALIALSDYVQRKIEEDREKGRFLQPEELEDYLRDFFDREYQGCEINHNTPHEGCFRIILNNKAHESLSDFIGDDRTLSARPFRQKEFSITFRREIYQKLSLSQRRSVHFVNHLSPLIRWITKINRDQSHGFYDVSAIVIHNSSLPIGDYCYRIERWKLKGLSNRETLTYGIAHLESGQVYPAEESEFIIQSLLRQGKDWEYVDCDLDALVAVHRSLEDELFKRFSTAVVDFEAENETAYQIKVQRATNLFDRRIEQDKQRLQTLHQAGRDARAIRMMEGRLAKGIDNKEKRIQELKEKAAVDIEQEQVAAGVFRVM
ncbi:MAG: helicase-related protein [Desulfomonilia bacterium]